MATKPKKFDVISIGGATVDILFYSKEGELINTGHITKQKLLAFEYGAKISADRVYFTYGGGAANSAVAFSRLGLNAGIISRIGSDNNGQLVINNIKKNKIDSSLLKIDAKASTGFSVILTINNESKEHVAFIHRGANSFLSVKDIDLSLVSTNWFYVTSLPKDHWPVIMTKVVQTGKNIIWNPGHEQLTQLPKLKAFLPKIKLLMLNHEEALEFRKLKDIKGLITYIRKLGPEIVVITDGAKGAYAYDGKKYHYIKARSVKNINTLGVGDAFGSGLTAGLIYDKNIKQALEWGIKNSASVVSEIGAQKGLLSRRQIEK
ncbi:MAG: carbohydrate kinase family protein [Patescibacteria group bacterium]